MKKLREDSLCTKLQHNNFKLMSQMCLKFRVQLETKWKLRIAWQTCIFFYIFIHNRSFRDTLLNFNISQTLECMFLVFCLREFTAAINFPCFKSWWRIGVLRKHHFLKKYNTGRKYIKTIKYSNLHKKKQQKLWAIFVQLSILHCYNNNSYNVNQCCIFDKIVSLIPIVIKDLEQGIYLGAVNTRR